jgi:hypothetical protein
MKNTNSKKIPRSQADVDKAYDRGIITGFRGGDLLWMNAILDKYEDQIDLISVWNSVKKLQEEVSEGRITFKDVKSTLKNEYKIDMDI